MAETHGPTDFRYDKNTENLTFMKKERLQDKDVFLTSVNE